MSTNLITRVRGYIHADFGVDLVTFDPVTSGLDDAHVWHAAAADGAEFAVKWSSGGTTAGLLVPAALAASGSGGVAAPRRSRDGRPWSVRDGRRLSMSPWAAGPHGWQAPMSRNQWMALGRVLRAAHDLTPDPALAATLAHETYDPTPQVRLCDDVDARLAHPGRGDAGDDLIDVVRQTWLRDRDRIIAVRDQALDLGRRLRARRVRPADVVCHSDAHGGNVVVRGAGDVVLLDWDDAVFGPKERDLMFVMSPGLWFAGTDHHDGFADGYGVAATVDPEVLAYVRSVRALDDVADLAAWVLDPHRYSTAQRETAARLVDAALSPEGQVAVALGRA